MPDMDPVHMVIMETTETMPNTDPERTEIITQEVGHPITDILIIMVRLNSFVVSGFCGVFDIE
jgi:hypothetical protein